MEKRQIAPTAAVAALAKNRGELSVEALNRLVANARAAIGITTVPTVRAPRGR